MNITPSPSSAMPPPSGSNQNSSTQTDSKDANKFSDEMDKKGKKTEKNKSDGKGEATQGGTSELAQLFQTAGPGKVQTVAKSDMVGKAEQVAAQIDAQNAASTKEVKVHFGKDLLPETSVTIKKVDGGLKLEFTTTSSESSNFLKNGAEALKTALSQKIDGDIDVSVTNEAGGMSDHDQQNSKGTYLNEDEDSTENPKNKN